MSRNARKAWSNRNEEMANAYISSGRTLLKHKRTDEAIHSFRQALPLAPRNARLHADLGQLLAKRKQTAEAVSMLQRSLELDPQQVGALVKLGEIYNQQNEPERAEPLLQQALALEPQNTAAHLVMGVVRHHQSRLPEALTCYRQALALRLAKPMGETPRAARPDFNQPQVEQLLWSTLATLAKAGVHAFAAYGTLLGLTREGHLLPFDKDIDFGLPHCEMSRATHCLLGNGWVEPVGSHRLSNPKAFYHPRYKISLDLSGFVVDAATGVTHTGFWLKDAPHEWHRHTRYPELTLDKGTSPCGKAIWQLAAADTWLTTVYGDWRTPDAFFDTVIAAKNLCGFSLLTECYAISRIYSHIDSGSLLKAQAVAGHALRHRPDDALLLDAHAKLSAVL
ncbi:MAG: tetratricopeptide repeat protein [Pseudomonas sp.]|uniref:tetratricopeptide repeat protein n=1 Tax=Pseudomonas abieticivorans TaxID=2931382 RepID=UPI0020BE259A|nr:tetratricopeptide repeat protein [Pseudomonas sp. PIA16]MDE1168424.1 tetratricopeptide repeat protein [Pseudomonas sp.]